MTALTTTIAAAGTFMTVRDPGSWTPAELIAGVGALVVATAGVLVVGWLTSADACPSEASGSHPAGGLKDAA